MKIKTIFSVGLFLLVLVSLTGIYAETVTVGNSSFTLPEGFEVYSVEPNQVALLNGNESAIRVYSDDSVEDDSEVLKEYRLKLGYTLTSEDNYESDGIMINKQIYTKDNTTTSAYQFTKNNKTYRIVVSVLNGYSVLEDYDYAVNEIIKSLN